MNREIEFRGKKMTAPYEFIYGDVCQYPKTKWVGILNHESIICDPIEVDYNTVGQYIGIRDTKIQTKIFEGDIVDIIHPCWTARCVVVFKDGAFWFIEKNNPINNSWVRADKFMKEKWQIEVIGNIHDNPELLK